VNSVVRLAASRATFTTGVSAGAEAPSPVQHHGSSAGGVLAIAAYLGLVACLFAVLAAVLPVRPLGFDHALTGGVCALGSSGHKDLRPESTPRQGSRSRSSV
jgi:hypothetical protein